VKFPYRKEPATPGPAHKRRTKVLRPRIRIRLVHGKRSIELLSLVDSGADDCIFPLEVAEELNLRLDPRNANLYGGIGAGHIRAIFSTVTLEVNHDIMIPLYAGFSDAPSVVPILGQAGFFDQFEVNFNRPHELIELRFIEQERRSSSG
jgi:hypothetical protein